MTAKDPGSNLGHAYCTVMDCGMTPIAEPALELYSRAAPSVEAHHLVSGPNTGRNSRGMRIFCFAFPG